MKPRLIAVAATLSLGMALTGCLGGSKSTFDTALGWMGDLQDAQRLGIRFVDVAGIRDAVGYDGDGTEAIDPTDPSPQQRWGLSATRLGVPDVLAGGPQGVGILSGPTMEWSIANYASLDEYLVVVHNTPDAEAAPDRLAQAGWSPATHDRYWESDANPMWQKLVIAVEDRTVIVEPVGAAVRARQNASRSAADDSGIKAIRECLADPHLVHIVATGNDDLTTALAARVDRDGNATAWSCIHAPGRADEIAGTVRPHSPEVTITEQRIDGDVIRTELAVAGPDGGTMPAEAQLIASAPERPFPGF